MSLTGVLAVVRAASDPSKQQARNALAPILIGCAINLVLYGLTLCWQGRYWLFYKGDQ